jgi:kinesin family protein 1
MLMLRAEVEDPATPGTTHERVSKISLVDLAGSERANATGATNDRLREVRARAHLRLSRASAKES